MNLGDVVAKVFQRCALKECKAFSLGIVCSDCSRFACNDHIYFTPGLPPRPVCCSCIVERHPELFKTEAER